MKKHSTMSDHPGFKAAAKAAMAHYTAHGMSAKEAKQRAYGGIANASRHASAAAKRANPRLKRVKG